MLVHKVSDADGGGAALARGADDKGTDTLLHASLDILDRRHDLVLERDLVLGMVLHRQVEHVDLEAKARQDQLMCLVQLQNLSNVILFEEQVAHGADLGTDEQVLLDFLEVREAFKLEEVCSDVLPVGHLIQ